MKADVVRCRVLIKCQGCGEASEKEEACPKEGCKKEGKRFVRTCQWSGLYPHGGQESRPAHGGGAAGGGGEKKEGEKKE